MAKIGEEEEQPDQKPQTWPGQGNSSSSSGERGSKRGDWVRARHVGRTVTAWMHAVPARLRVQRAMLYENKAFANFVARKWNRWLGITEFVMYKLAVVLIFTINYVMYGVPSSVQYRF